MTLSLPLKQIKKTKAKTNNKMRNLTMMTDLYQLTMMYGYYRENKMNQQVVFDLFFRKPDSMMSSYAIAAGLEQVVEYREPESAPSSFGQVSKGREEVTQVSFEQALLKSGFSIDSVEDIKKSITGVHPRKLVSMDRILTREEKKLELEREGIEESGSEQSYG